MRDRRDAVGRVSHLHEGIPFDKDLIIGLDIRISRFQVEDEIGCGIGARRENSGVIATSVSIPDPSKLSSMFCGNGPHRVTFGPALIRLKVEPPL